MVDNTINLVEIKYKCDDDSSPVKIYNDMGLYVYIDLKKKNYTFNVYPLFITVKERYIHLIIYDVNEKNLSACL